ncbi:hypothetical protein EVA_13600 [gut metagenome]|uniref:Uncharacterized protein n=1 Tax=gut metagenome TaxID=749906 RepID=J9G946_9ZZZZ
MFKIYSFCSNNRALSIFSKSRPPSIAPLNTCVAMLILRASANCEVIVV